MPHLLEVQNLTRYFGGLAAVDNLDMEVKRGEIHGLIGPNGAGKTTVFNLISGVIQPTRGKVIFKGKDITGLQPHFVAKAGLVRTFQLTMLFGNFTLMQNVLMGCHLRSKIGFWEALFNTVSNRNKERELAEKTVEVLDFMGLANLKNELAKNLTHGQQRALGIAIALAADPELLMLDEPVTGMNPAETMAMMDTIRKIRDRGVTILLVEHDMKAVMGLCDMITVISFGKKLAEGLPDEIKKNKGVIEAYLGVEEGAA